MDKNSKNSMDHSKDTYIIPIRLYPKYIPFFKILIIFFTLCALGLSYLLISDITLKNDRVSIIDSILIIALFLFLGIDLVHGELLHKQYIELNNEGIKVKKLLYSKFINWADVLSIEIPTGYRSIQYIALRKIECEGFIKEIRRRLLKGYYISIRIVKYSEIDTHVLINTVKKKIKKSNYIKLSEY